MTDFAEGHTLKELGVGRVGSGWGGQNLLSASSSEISSRLASVLLFCKWGGHSLQEWAFTALLCVWSISPNSTALQLESTAAVSVCLFWMEAFAMPAPLHTLQVLAFHFCHESVKSTGAISPHLSAVWGAVSGVSIWENFRWIGHTFFFCVVLVRKRPTYQNKQPLIVSSNRVCVCFPVSPCCDPY